MLRLASYLLITLPIFACDVHGYWSLVNSGSTRDQTTETAHRLRNVFSYDGLASGLKQRKALAHKR
jgi:hypothetical protein